MILIVIPAKENSSRLPGKNMLLINGRPMVDYAIDEAQKCLRGYHLIVSTDSAAISEYVTKKGVDVVMRDERLAGDTPLYEVYKHAADYYGLDNFSLLVGLQVDHPDRTVSVDRAIDFFESELADYLTTVDGMGRINGSYKIYAKSMIAEFAPSKHVELTDNCTNIHYQEDLSQATKTLQAHKI